MRQLALRGLHVLQPWRREIVVVLAIGLVLGCLGPYGTYGCGSVICRIGYWMLRSALVGLICMAGFRAILASKPCGAWSPIGQASAGLFIASIPCAMIGCALAFALRHGPQNALEAADLYGRVAIVTAVVGVPLQLTRTIWPCRAAQTTEAPSPIESGFFRRLPARLGRDLLYIQVEDHYLRVHTRLGSELILLRLSDAVAELDPALGRQVHRSYWVARDAVASIERERHRVRLILTDGARIPISRTFLARLRADGWLAPTPRPDSSAPRA